MCLATPGHGSRGSLHRTSMLANLSTNHGTYIKFWHNGDRIHAHEGGGAQIGSNAYITVFDTGDSRMSVTCCTCHQTSLYVVLWQATDSSKFSHQVTQ